MEWRHNEDLGRWELGRFDIDRNEFRVRSWIHDEVVAEYINNKEMANYLHDRIGSLPPPFEEILKR